MTLLLDTHILVWWLLDQVIVATARVHGLRLVTADRRVRQSGVVSVV